MFVRLLPRVVSRLCPGVRNGAPITSLHELPEASDLDFKPTPALVTKRRAITRFQITESIYALRPISARTRKIAGNDSLERVPLLHLGQVALSGPHKRWIAEIRNPK